MSDRPASDQHWGIEPGYWDTEGVWHKTSAETRAVLLAAMGVDEATSAPPSPPAVRVVRARTAVRIRGPATLQLEEGARIQVDRDRKSVV